MRKAQAAHGVSVIEVELKDGTLADGAPVAYARRFTAVHAVRRRRPGRRPRADAGPRPIPAGRTVLGTLNNCASGMTPWGTYLSGEENFTDYFDGGDSIDAAPAALGHAQGRRGYRWHEYDERFDAAKHPNEPNRFGWVVEIDPIDPSSTPVKRTALGRAAHEGAWVAVTQGRPRRRLLGRGRALRVHLQVRQPRPRSRPAAARPNATLLDHGTLYVARFDADGTRPLAAAGRTARARSPRPTASPTRARW